MTLEAFTTYQFTTFHPSIEPSNNDTRAENNNIKNRVIYKVVNNSILVEPLAS